MDEVVMVKRMHKTSCFYHYLFVYPSLSSYPDSLYFSFKVCITFSTHQLVTQAYKRMHMTLAIVLCVLALTSCSSASFIYGKPHMPNLRLTPLLHLTDSYFVNVSDYSSYSAISLNGSLVFYAPFGDGTQLIGDSNPPAAILFRNVDG